MSDVAEIIAHYKSGRIQSNTELHRAVQVLIFEVRKLQKEKQHHALLEQICDGEKLLER